MDAAQASAEKAAIKPSRQFYVIGGVVASIGIGLILALVLTTLGQGMVRITGPGQGTLNLPAKGSYTIFLESESMIDGRLYVPGEGINGLQFKLVNKDQRIEIPLSRPWGTESYQYGGKSGTSVLTFDVASPGAYELTMSYPEGQNGPTAVFSIGRGLGRAILPILLIGLPTTFLAAGIILWTFLKRRMAAGLPVFSQVFYEGPFPSLFKRRR
jgi:hypothetical protein